MDSFIEKVESLLSAIRESELGDNSEASAKALEISKMVKDLKTKKDRKLVKFKNQDLLKYIAPKVLLEN